MTKLTFETATLADAIKKAEKVAPSRGQAFDKAAGIIMEVDPQSPVPVVVKATNLEVFWMEWISALEADGPETTWRLPSKLLAGIIGSLPLGTGRTVTMQEMVDGASRQIILTSGRTKSRLNLFDHEYYPVWSAFDPDDLIQANDLGGRIAQVEWAAAKAEPPISGVHLDGEHVVATDRYRLCRVPLSVPDLEQPVTVPAGVLAGLIQQTGETNIAVTGEQLLVMPDEHRQIRTVLFGQDYPSLKKIMSREYDNKVKFKKTGLLELINRALNFVGSDRFPTLRLYLGKEEIAVIMGHPELGQLNDILEVPGYCDHGRVEVKFSPRNIMDALTNAPNDEVELHYSLDGLGRPMKIDGGSGYEAWVMPRKDIGDK